MATVLSLSEFLQRFPEERPVGHGTATKARFQIIPDIMDAFTEDTFCHGFLSGLSPHRGGRSR